MFTPDTSASVRISSADPNLPESRALFQQLWDELGKLYGDTGPCAFLPADVSGPGTAFMIAWLENEPVGCGAIRPMEPGTGEVKRMFVAQQVRRWGIAKAILVELEAIAQRLEYTTLRLETGTRQPGAIRLYEETGYQRIPCYGQHADDPLSICFEKRL